MTGRRLVFSLGMALLVARGPVLALGAQADPLAEPVEAQEPAPLAPAEPPPLSPADLPPADLPPERPAAIGLDAAPAPRARPLQAVDPLQDPDVERAQAPAAAPAPRKRPLAVDPLRDQAVEQAQAPAPAPAPAAAAGDGGFMLPLDRLPLGRHEVVVDVEVQAPAEMNKMKPATAVIIVANTGSSDAFDVVVRDELPAGLRFISSTVPPDDKAMAEKGLLTWNLGTLAAGASKRIPLQVEPTQAVHMDHAATVSFRAGSKARSLVREPKLKVEVVQAPSVAKQLKGKTVDFRISVTNTGDGPARGIMVLAKLSPGLRHETLARSEDNSLEHPIDVLGPGDRYDLPTLTVDASQGGPQTCVVTAKSADVVFAETDAQVACNVDVVEPKVKIDLAAPEKRYTDTVGQYAVTVENPGTAPARNVMVSVALPVSGRLVATPPEAVFDRRTQRLVWTIAELPPTNDPANPAAKPRVLPFEVRLGDVGFYEVTAEAKADGVAVERQKRSTDVQGMADLDVMVFERKRVVDEGGETMFLIKLHNYGKKEAVDVAVEALVSKNLQPTEISGGSEGKSGMQPEDKGVRVFFPKIDRVAPGATMVLGVKVTAAAVGDGIGTCEVDVKQADATAAVLKGMANVKVTQGRRSAAAAEADVK